MKTMKKTLAAVFALALAFALTACTGNNKTEETTAATITETTAAPTEAPAPVKTSYVGTWKLTNISMTGLTMDPSAMGMEMLLVIKEGGDAEISSNENGETDTAKGKWEEVEGGIKVTSENESLEFKMVDGKLAVEEEQDGMTFSMSFERQAQ